LSTNSTVDNFSLVRSVVSPGGAPSFQSGEIIKLSNGSFSLTATGAVGPIYKLWASTNVALTSVTNLWTLVPNGTIGASLFTIIDANATNFPQRFYLFSTP
jgi:hypothetical protein